MKIGELHGDGKCSPFESAFAGSMAGGFAASVTTPLDVIKTRLMLRVDSSGVPYSGPASTFKRIVAREGFGALFSGVGPRTLWIAIGGFIYFGVYSTTSELLKKKDNR